MGYLRPPAVGSGVDEVERAVSRQEIPELVGHQHAAGGVESGQPLRGEVQGQVEGSGAHQRQHARLHRQRQVPAKAARRPARRGVSAAQQGRHTVERVQSGGHVVVDLDLLAEAALLHRGAVVDAAELSAEVAGGERVPGGPQGVRLVQGLQEELAHVLQRGGGGGDGDELAGEGGGLGGYRGRRAYSVREQPVKSLHLKPSHRRNFSSRSASACING